eukprot:Phypoly_transcript_29383.p1 GENE.Phypoly_transcript_29383~~Phypoly_transcript_29383.p1  ORF type:complete len:112 (+),score=18.43 Phypoly_transcript_29383:37-372(+)
MGMFRCASNSLLNGANATFTIKYNTQPGQNVFVVGSIPELGEWDISKAKKLSWNCGNTWDINIGFDETNTHVEYKYFVQTEFCRDVNWEHLENRSTEVYDGMTCDDTWDRY